MRLAPTLDRAMPPGIELYHLELALGEGELSAAHLLTAGERVHARRFRQRADRARFAQTRAAVRTLLGARLSCCPRDVPLALGMHGKPFIEGINRGMPLFNVSHSGGHALIAIADASTMSDVGVDIEQLCDDIDTEPMLDLAFTAHERGEVLAAAEPVTALYARWVGKEAVLKAVGVGVPEHLLSVGIHPQTDGPTEIVCDQPAWAGFEVLSLIAPLGYAAALAWRRKDLA